MADAEIFAVEVQREDSPPVIGVVDPFVDVLAEAPQVVALDQFATQFLVVPAEQAAGLRVDLQAIPAILDAGLRRCALSGAASRVRGAITA